MTSRERIHREAQDLPLAYRVQIAALFMTQYRTCGIDLDRFDDRLNLFLISQIPGRATTRGRVADDQLNKRLIALKKGDFEAAEGHKQAVSDIANEWCLFFKEVSDAAKRSMPIKRNGEIQ